MLKKYLLPVLCLLAAAAAAAEDSRLRLATTTSLENSGLLEHLLPAFEAQCVCRVHVIPVGTGKALALGRRGDVDALLVHAPAAEEQFIREGYGIDRRQVAYNHFVLLAPPQTELSAAEDALAVLEEIHARRLKFLSRGDDSGTHKKERFLWQQLRQTKNIAPRYAPDWYIEAGVGMGQAIIMADQLGAYVLSDSGTYLHLQEKVRLTPLPLPPSPLLHNPYSVIRINPERHPHINHALAKQFADWLQQPDARRRISAYRLRGEALFTPAGE